MAKCKTKKISGLLRRLREKINSGQITEEHLTWFVSESRRRLTDLATPPPVAPPPPRPVAPAPPAPPRPVALVPQPMAPAPNGMPRFEMPMPPRPTAPPHPSSEQERDTCDL